MIMGKPDWSREGRDWPNREASRFVQAAGLKWHVQILGRGPPLLLLHGAGAATHSWRDLAPRLADRFTLVAPDLPGHGFTQTPHGAGLSLEGMSAGVGDLLGALGIRPEMAVGHSAGAALALALRLSDRIGERGVVSINGALKPFPGAAGHVFPAMAKLLFVNPFADQVFAWRASQPGAVERLLEGTGSRIDKIGLEAYSKLLRTTGHVGGALGMMAHWDLHGLQARLADIPMPLTLISGLSDRAVPPDVARSLKARAPQATLIELKGLGHLAHEEDPGRLAGLIVAAFDGP